MWSEEMFPLKKQWTLTLRGDSSRVVSTMKSTMSKWPSVGQNVRGLLHEGCMDRRHLTLTLLHTHTVQQRFLSRSLKADSNWSSLKALKWTTDYTMRSSAQYTCSWLTYTWAMYVYVCKIRIRMQNTLCDAIVISHCAIWLAALFCQHPRIVCTF